MQISEMLKSVYLEYVNDYMTVSKMADDKGVDKETLTYMITEGKRLHDDEVAYRQLK